MHTTTIRKRAGLITATLLCTLLSGCATTLGKAKQTGSISQQVYTAVESETVSRIVAIVQKDKNGTVTQEDREQLRLLNELRKDLDKFAEAHNTYISALKVWETSGTRPATVDEVSTQMLTLIGGVQDLAKRLNIRIPRS